MSTNSHYLQVALFRQPPNIEHLRFSFPFLCQKILDLTFCAPRKFIVWTATIEYSCTSKARAYACLPASTYALRHQLMLFTNISSDIFELLFFFSRIYERSSQKYIARLKTRHVHTHVCQYLHMPYGTKAYALFFFKCTFR